MRSKTPLPNPQDAIGRKMQEEYRVLCQNFDSPRDFASFIHNKIKTSTESILSGNSWDTSLSADKVEAKAQAEYSRFLISRARATGARSLTEIQKWYFDVMAYRRAMDSVENLPKSSKTRADDDQDTSKENTGGEIK